MGAIHRSPDRRASGPHGRQDSAASLMAARWRLRAMLTSVDRDLDEAADEQVYIEAEITRSLDHATRLESQAAAAVADGCGEVAGELHEELIQTRAFLDELTEVRQKVLAEQDRLAALRRHLADRLAEYDRQAGAA
jgi:hypothetical protein